MGSELMVMAEARLTLPPRPAPFLSGASHLVGVRGRRRLGVGVGEVRVRVRVRIFPPRLAGGLVVEVDVAVLVRVRVGVRIRVRVTVRVNPP